MKTTISEKFKSHKMQINQIKSILGKNLDLRILLTTFLILGFASPSYCDDTKIQLSKKIFFENKSLGLITDIKYGKFNPNSKDELAIVGIKGVTFLDENNLSSKVTAFDGINHYVKIIDVESDGISEYENQGGGWQDVSLINHEGKTLWRYSAKERGEGSAPNDMASGDIALNGKYKFFVPLNPKGMSIFDKSNSVISYSALSGSSIKIANVDETKELEILLNDNQGKVLVYNYKGKVLKTVKSSAFINQFTLINLPKTRNPNIIFYDHKDKNNLWIVDLDGAQIAKLPTPEIYEGYRSRLHAMAVLINADKSEYLAVLMEFNRSNPIFFLYDENKNLVYRENMPEKCSSIYKKKSVNDNTENLLIGCEGKVFQYQVL